MLTDSSRSAKRFTLLSDCQFNSYRDTADLTHVVVRQFGGYSIPGNTMNRGDQLYKIRPINTCLTERTSALLFHLLATVVIDLTRLVAAFVPRLAGGRHTFSVFIVAVHGWLGGCRQCRKPRRNCFAGRYA